METQNIKYKCEKCNYQTNYKSSYDKHLRSVLHLTGEKKIRSDKKINICEICKLELATQQSLKQHKLNMHSNLEIKEKDFKYYCVHCKIGTNIESIYKKHELTKKHNSILNNINFNTL
jgi:hypothetical protein